MSRWRVVGVITAFLPQCIEDRALQGKNKGRRLIGGKSGEHALPRQVFQKRPHRLPTFRANVIRAVCLRARRQHVQKLTGLLSEVLGRQSSLRGSRCLLELLQPIAEYFLAAIL